MKKGLLSLRMWVDTLILVLPVGWVFTCYDGGWADFCSGAYLAFIWHLLCACIISTLLIGFGMHLSGQTMTEDSEFPRPCSQWAAIGMEMLVLLIATYKLLG